MTRSGSLAMAGWRCHSELEAKKLSSAQAYPEQSRRGKISVAIFLAIVKVSGLVACGENNDKRADRAQTRPAL
jgi:hypothetical protein